MKTIEKRVFVKYLKSLGLEHKRTKGNHEVWDKKTPPFYPRPIIIRTHLKEIPLLHIQTNLKTLGVSHKDLDAFIAKN